MEPSLINNSNCYEHKKFASQKRKRDVDQILEQNKENMSTQEAPPSKRRQSKSFFRPWLDNEQNIESSVSSNESQKRSSTPIPPGGIYHANMVRQCQSPRQQRSPKEQQRRDRNTLSCLLNRRAKQLHEAHLARQYEQYRAQQAAILEQQVRFSLYYRQLLQQAVFQRGVPAPGTLLPQQQQQFLQQMALSQQLLIFGSQQ
ncbi:protein Mabiki [Drosophila grimshawi]|uniref:GH22261 n=1 Tax=Drosophila grimshawi TaxID=7222 RepID=B4JZD0_DROGR|nr:protein Mabiki [Drosophila grimshawi]EDV94052.1 GH25090 [Drosophila grimshawi]EDW05145.1 GH22261 [Drosophila grimshawi]